MWRGPPDIRLSPTWWMPTHCFSNIGIELLGLQNQVFPGSLPSKYYQLISVVDIPLSDALPSPASLDLITL